jgi:hypothetical protein
MGKLRRWLRREMLRPRKQVPRFAYIKEHCSGAVLSANSNTTKKKKKRYSP